ncbi:MAG: DUF4423 domain-containing protein [Bdellovibrionales bacterium]|nr:DUF4423 domain-containing protein [Bdellovibrionales bacterium]
MEHTLTRDFQSDPRFIAKALGLNVVVTRQAIERLKRLDLLIEDADGRLKASEPFTASPAEVPSEAIRKFHRQILQKALDAVDLQTVGQRDLSSLVLAVGKDDIPEAKRVIKHFRRSFDARFAKSPKKDSVYCLAIQFFDLTCGLKTFQEEADA